MGFLAVLFTMIPYVLLGQDAIFTYHDQLDGEVIAYLLQARRLFHGDILPEFMNGASKTALIPPAPLFVLLFLPGDSYMALVIMLLFGRLCGYFGMYLLCRTFVKENWIAAGTGVLFACLPFLPVYGLSQFGIPLLFWCVIQLMQGRHMLPAWCGVVLFTLCSSLVLVGFGLLGMGFILLVWKLWKSYRDRENRLSFFRFLAAWLLMLGIYVAENCRLLWQMLGETFASHKSEYVLAAEPFWDSLSQNLLKGGQHSEDIHVWLLAAALAAALVWLLAGVWRKKTLDAAANKQLRVIAFCLGWNLFFSFVASVWNGAAGVRLRSAMSAMGSFQMDRVIWISPCLWYLLASCGMALTFKLFSDYRKNPGVWCFGLAMAAAVCVTGVQILMAGDIKSNVQKLRNPDYGMLSFREYYAIGVMDQVMDFLREETGAEPEEYRVVSLGIDPAAALYHGFYCLDGYSNNYSLEYKHAFQKLLKPELDKSEYLKEYFEGWGNRCYLFSSECPGYYTIEKNGFYFQNYQLDTEAMEELGGRYLLSAAYIANAEELGLKLMREMPFETTDSYYCIFVYETAENGNTAERQ